MLARFGCRVTAIERVPALCALLQQAADGADGDVEVVLADAGRWLRDLAPDDAPDAVYLDPMFAARGRAQVKKEMQALRALSPPSEPGELSALFDAARATARERVVVKRHPHHEALAPGASHTVTAERIRFDVYLS